MGAESKRRLASEASKKRPRGNKRRGNPERRRESAEKSPKVRRQVTSGETDEKKPTLTVSRDVGEEDGSGPNVTWPEQREVRRHERRG